MKDYCEIYLVYPSYVSFAKNIAVKDVISARCTKFWLQNCFRCLCFTAGDYADE